MNKKEFEKNRENFDATKKEIEDLQKMIMEFAEEADYIDVLSPAKKNYDKYDDKVKTVKEIFQNSS